MSKLSEHEARKKVLLDWYDRLAGEAMLWRDHNGADSAVALKAHHEARANLEAERFIVAVCGQMNVGKSTLLNALLFGDSILPASPTTMTAKIALLQGGTTPRIEATLYSADEFPGVMRSAEQDSSAFEDLAYARERAREAGLNEEELLQRPARVEKRERLESLAQFVAVPDDGGTYTPYVSSVNVYADVPWLHLVTVADTPGTNDPNPERDRITKEWISKADAVVYLTYAGQAGFTADDKRFLDNYLLHLDPRRRIIAVNKCDSQPDAEAIRSNFRTFRERNGHLGEKLLGDDRNIVLVSGVSALISSLLAQGKPLTGELKSREPGLRARGWLAPEKHGVEYLRDLIEERIIRLKGDGVLSSHESRLASLFEKAERRNKAGVDDLNQRIQYLSTSSEQLQRERQHLKGAVDRLDRVVKEVRAELLLAFEGRYREMDDQFKRLARRISTNILEQLKEVTHIKNLPAHSIWLVPHALEQHYKEIGDALTEIARDSGKLLERAETNLSEELLTSTVGEIHVQRHILDISANTIVEDIFKQVKESMNASGFKELIHDTTNWWQRLFNTRGGRMEAVEALHPELSNAVSAALSKISSSTYRQVEEKLRQELESMNRTIAGMLQGRRESIERLTREGFKADEERALALKELDVIFALQKQVESLQSEFNRAVKA